MSLSRKALESDTHYGFIDQSTSSHRIYNPRLVRNANERTMRATLIEELKRSQSFKFSVAFINSSGLAALNQALLDFDGEGVIYTSTYLDFNEPAVFEELLKYKNIEVRVLDDSIDAFHSKGYIFKQAETTSAVIGSSNLTRGALMRNEEWNLHFSAMPDGHIVNQLDDAIDRLYSVSQRLTPGWIAQYEARRKLKIIPTAFDLHTDPVVPVGEIQPNPMQQEALQGIKKVWDAGEKRALVISATGTGKTILAALAVRETKPQKVLFIAHREQILNKSIEDFQKVLNTERADSFGKYVGSTRQLDKKYVFASVQTLSREDNLGGIDPDLFDYVVIDEVHRAGAPTYRRIIDYLKPNYLLGLTATPERSDDTSIYELFDYNVAYEIRLQQALEAKMLVPFSYSGVSDYTKDGEVIGDTSDLSTLVMNERISYIIKMLEEYGRPRDVKGLMFCSRKEEAWALSAEFNRRKVNGKLLRTSVLTGDNSQKEREDAIALLEAGEIDYILSVDVFNEGIDIPVVNQVVMLRHTESSIIFTQQLGRGLRKSQGKTHLRVIDFIGNYKNNFLIPIALFGDNSLDKDTLRQRIIDTRQTGVLAGVSDISFEKVAEERVLKALGEAKLTVMATLKESYREIRNRLKNPPTRYDLARFDAPDPTAFLTSGKDRITYWHFLQKVEKDEPLLTEQQQGYLTLFDRELLNGKRPQELLLMKSLLRSQEISVEAYRKILDEYGAASDELTIRSVAALLTLEFFSAKDRPRYGGKPVVLFDGTVFRLASDFSTEYSAEPYFKKHIDDSIRAGLYLNQHHFNRAGKLEIGKRYSRKDVCRLLNWEGNYESTMYGYKANELTKTCPIFITYHKSDEIDDAINYDDGFEDESTVRWFTRHGMKLNSKLEKKIIAGDYALDIFVKKSDADDDTQYLYIGQSEKPRDAQQTTKMVKGKEAPIVTMKLDLIYPLRPSLLEYFTTKYEDKVPAS